MNDELTVKEQVKVTINVGVFDLADSGLQAAVAAAVTTALNALATRKVETAAVSIALKAAG